MVTLNQTREYISGRKNFYTPVLHKALLQGLDDISSLQPDVDDVRTAVVFYWHGYALTYESAEKILLGLELMPDGLVIKVQLINRLFH